MATEIQLEIVTPMKNAFSGKVLQVVLPAWHGEEGVLPDHDDKLALLRGGICTVFTPGGELRFAIGRGFAEMGDDHVTLLTDSCIPADEVDKEEVRSQLADLEKQLEASDYVSESAKAIQARIEVLQAQLAA